MRADPRVDWMKEAVELSKRCPPSKTAFSVGAVLVHSSGRLIATGYSREVGAEHAEEVALEKARRAKADLVGSTLFSTLEPCSVRASGKAPCAARLIEAGIARVVFALHEPNVFVDCQGAKMLADAGIDVVVRVEFAPAVRQINAHLLPEVGQPGGPSE